MAVWNYQDRRSCQLTQTLTWKCVTHHTTTTCHLPCEQLCRFCVVTPHAQEIYAALFCFSMNMYNHCLMLQQSPIQYLESNVTHQVKQNKCANRWYTGIPWNTTHWWRLPSVFKEHHSNFRKISWFSRSILWSLRPLPCLPGYQHYLQASSMSSSKTQQVLESNVNHCRWQETL